MSESLRRTARTDPHVSIFHALDDAVFVLDAASRAICDINLCAREMHEIDDSINLGEHRS